MRRPSPATLAARARRQLAAGRRPHASFDPARYFRSDVVIKFHGVGVPTVRRIARTLHAEVRDTWSVAEALQFADRLIRDEHLETKQVGVELLARYRRHFTPRLLRVWKGWLAGNHAANWATTDAICGMLIGPLLVMYPRLARDMPGWARHRNLWVRRASAVGLIPLVRHGHVHDLAYNVAARLHPDPADLIHKAVGWMLREAGKAGLPRLTTYLMRNGPRIPRTTVRYAIERMPERVRLAVLARTRRQ